MNSMTAVVIESLHSIPSFLMTSCQGYNASYEMNLALKISCVSIDLGAHTCSLYLNITASRVLAIH